MFDTHEKGVALYVKTDGAARRWEFTTALTRIQTGLLEKPEESLDRTILLGSSLLCAPSHKLRREGSCLSEAQKRSPRWNLAEPCEPLLSTIWHSDTEGLKGRLKERKGKALKETVKHP